MFKIDILPFGRSVSYPVRLNRKDLIKGSNCRICLRLLGIGTHGCRVHPKLFFKVEEEIGVPQRIPGSDVEQGSPFA